MRRSLVIAAVVTLAAGHAQAHARLLTGTPKAGATVAAPRLLRLRYSETIVPAASRVAVVGPGGVVVALGPLSLDPKDRRVVLVPVSARLAPGAYKVTWTVRTTDGHTTDGRFAFSVN